MRSLLWTDPPEEISSEKAARERQVTAHLYLLFITLVGFVLFDASSVGEAIRTVGRLFGVGTVFTNVTSTYYAKSYAFIIVIASILATPLMRNIYLAAKKHRGGERLRTVIEPVACVAILIVSTAYLVDGSYNPFMYFRF